MKRIERSWMYERLDANKKFNPGFVNGVNEFIKHAKQLPSFWENNGTIRCPCIKCSNTKFKNEHDVRVHLTKNGFCLNYYDWVCHGEEFSNVVVNYQQGRNVNPYQNMVHDALGDHIFQLQGMAEQEDNNENPNPEVAAFFEMLRKAEEVVSEGSSVSVLQAASRLLTLKCEHNLSHKCVDGITGLIGDILPKNNLMTTNFYQTKKLLKALELPHEKIHVCPAGCMLFWEEYAKLDNCWKCGLARYKSNTNARGQRVPNKVMTYFPIGPRLQRLYATKHIGKEMRWHAENPRTSGIIAHPSDAEAWKHFDQMHPEFANESRNVRLGLCTDGFAPFGNFGKNYSCWPVMVTPYNLPPWLCMKRPFIFLAVLVPGPKNPKGNLDVYLQPLIRELNQLWETGLYTYDVSTKQNFHMRAALMWTINDFPAYGMLSGWTTAGLNACPYCCAGTKAFWLPNSCKCTWFDCHRRFLPEDHIFRKDKGFLKCRPYEDDTPPRRLSGEELWEFIQHLPSIIDGSDADLKRLKNAKNGWWKRSIFWDLPYWKTLLIRHCLDVMHIEKNFFEKLMDTVMDVKDKTACGPKSLADTKKYCRKRPDCKIVLDKPRRKVLCEWVTKLKFPDGYASDLSRCVDHEQYILRGLKSHDCHVFMERLLPVALRELIPKNEWNVLTEISQFFRDLCVATLKIEDVIRLENNIAEIICKLEKILPPAFFNSMEHLPVHLPYELRVGGPVQYRWMYPFERFLNNLKQKIGNKAFVEGSICNAYLLEEVSNFCSMYYDDNIETKAKNLDVGESSNSAVVSDIPELFRDHNGTTTGKSKTRYLTDQEYNCVHKYVLNNCETVTPYHGLFETFIRVQHPRLTSTEIWNEHEHEFPKWFTQQAPFLNDEVLKALAFGPSRMVNTWKRYSINGYNFRTFNRQSDIGKSSVNNGVCVSSTDGDDFYGTLNEIIELVYYAPSTAYKAVLFKCDWLDNSRRGMDVHPHYKIVEVHRGRKYGIYEPFVLAYQVEQVYYAPYPSLKKDKEQWSVVIKTKARSTIEAPVEETVFQEQVINDAPRLSDPLNQIDVDDLDDDSDDELHVDDEMAYFIQQRVDVESENEDGEEEEFVDDLNTDEEDEVLFLSSSDSVDDNDDSE